MAVATPAKCKTLVEATFISPKLIMKWGNHADLMRINGVSPQFAELLEAAGVDTVKQFQHLNAENIYAKMTEVNEYLHLIGRVHAISELQKIINQAKKVTPAISY